jgi:hypothetical protein
MSKIFVASKSTMKGGGGKVSSDLPLFMRDGGDAEIERRGKELETYLNLLTLDPFRMLQKTMVACNPDTMKPHEVGDEVANEVKAWWKDPETKKDIMRWACKGSHVVDGEDWFNGIFGSRWTDQVINGRQTRIAFYADKGKYAGRNYALVLDSSLGSP